MEFIANMIVIGIVLATVAEAGLIINSITLAITLATLATADHEPSQFSFGGIEMNMVGSSFGCANGYLYYSVRDARGKDQSGYFTIQGCMDSEEHLEDETYRLDIYRDQKSALLTQKSSGASVRGCMSEENIDRICTTNVFAPDMPDITFALISGSGGGAGRPTFDHCAGGADKLGAVRGKQLIPTHC